MFLVAVGVCRKTSIIIVRKLLDQPNEPTVVLTVHGQLECTAVKMELRTVLTECANRVSVEQLDVDSPRSTWECAKQIIGRYTKLSGLVIDAKSFKDVRILGGPPPGHAVSWAPSAVFAVFDALACHLLTNAHVAVLSSQLGVAATLKMSDSQRSTLLRSGLSIDDIAQLAEQFLAENAAASRHSRAPHPSTSSASWVGIDVESFSYTLLHALVLAMHKSNPRLSIYAIACMPGASLDAEEARAVASVTAKSGTGLGGQLFGNGGAPVAWSAEKYGNVAWSETAAALKRATASSMR
jgi:hypothetical protein